MKSIEFLNKPATAVYFYDMTSNIKTIKLTNRLLKEEKKNAAQTLSPNTLSKEVHEPLMSILMLLQSLIMTALTECQNRYIRLLIAQTNMLTCLVNNVLDRKRIEQDQFKKNL